MALSKNPADVLERQQQPTIAGLAREHVAKQKLRSIYIQRAIAVGLPLAEYCKRFGIRGVHDD